MAPLAGCMTVSLNPPYPPDWPAPVADRVGVCPSISGRYVNLGQMHLEAGASCEGTDRPEDGLWDCSVLLTSNLGLPVSGPVAALAQPDADTLTVSVTGDDRVPREVRQLRRGRDFQCDAESLFFSDTRSMLGSPGMTALGIVMLSGGINHHSRAFARNAAGELVMTVRQRTTGYHLLFGWSGTTTNHVRWRAAETAP
ncbi:MAG TPA: hypothetical protein VLE94_22240 [Burkholderiaceae bacterium]|nr:hypothetical protein [Burkholderiaceae bacterium]